jgi:TLD
LIRFNQITSTEFHKEIEPYKKIIDKKLYEEIIQIYHNNNDDDDWQPRLLLQRCPRIKEGKLLNSRMKYLISGWIDLKKYSYKEDELPYEFQLILQGTKDGFSRTIFEQKCYNIEQTIVMMKIKETGELVGGYNPVCWNLKEKFPNDSYWIETDKSFIFKIDENQLDNSILSRVKCPKYAIYNYGKKVDFTCDCIKFHEITISFSDLELDISINNEPYCYYQYNGSYKINLNLRNSNKEAHLLEEYEVYKIVKKN